MVGRKFKEPRLQGRLSCHARRRFPKGRVDESLVREVTKDFDLPENVPMFLFVGRMMWYKGLKIILDALKLLREQGTVFRMVFVGNGGDREEVISYCESLRLSGHACFYRAGI